MERLAAIAQSAKRIGHSVRIPAPCALRPPGQRPSRAGGHALCVLFVLALPWTTGIRGWAPSAAEAVMATPILIFWGGTLAMLSMWLMERDVWLGIFGLWLAIRATVSLGPPMLEAATLAVFGLVLIDRVREMPADWRRWAGIAIAVGGAGQALYALIQWAGSLGGSPDGLRPIGAYAPEGMLGNSGWLGSYLSLSIAFAPAWALPLWGAGIYLSGSTLSGVAAAAAFAIRYHTPLPHPPPQGGRVSSRVGVSSSFAALLGVLLLGERLAQAGFALPSSWASRLETWQIAAGTLHGWPLLIGYGPGSWPILADPLQSQRAIRELYLTVHNDLLQLAVEAGLVAVLLLGVWLWTHRRAILSGSAGAAVAAIAIQAMGHFPFHIATLGTLACVIIGLATAHSAKGIAHSAERIESDSERHAPCALRYADEATI